MESLKSWRPWIAPCLAMSVSSCGTVEVVDSPPPPRPPATLLRPCPHPAGDPSTLREMVALVLDYTAALDNCNADKAAVRAFYEALDKGT